MITGQQRQQPALSAQQRGERRHSCPCSSSNNSSNSNTCLGDPSHGARAAARPWERATQRRGGGGCTGASQGTGCRQCACRSRAAVLGQVLALARLVAAWHPCTGGHPMMQCNVLCWWSRRGTPAQGAIRGCNAVCCGGGEFVASPRGRPSDGATIAWCVSSAGRHKMWGAVVESMDHACVIC
eukprot:1161802-Pelagomonas_calceolata.AAC.2